MTCRFDLQCNPKTVAFLARRLRVLYLVAWLVLVPACAQSEVATPRPVVVQIAGATSMHPVLGELSSAFTELHSNVLFEIRGGGSALGEARVREGRSSIAASTLIPAQTEPGGEGGSSVGAESRSSADSPASAPAAPANSTGGGIPLVRAPIGLDGIAIVVHGDNPVTTLTSQQLQELFNGRILDWAEVGGDAGEISLVSREDGSGARHVFEARIMRGAPVSLTAVVMPTSRDVVDYVSKHPQSIGYVSNAYVARPDGRDQSAATDPEEAGPFQVQTVAVDGVLPSDSTIVDQSYPLVQPLYLVTAGTAQGWNRQFIDFALSPAGQSIVDRHHVPVR